MVQQGKGDSAGWNLLAVRKRNGTQKPRKHEPPEAESAETKDWGREALGNPMGVGQERSAGKKTKRLRMKGRKREWVTGRVKIGRAAKKQESAEKKENPEGVGRNISNERKVEKKTGKTMDQQTSKKRKENNTKNRTVNHPIKKKRAGGRAHTPGLAQADWTER